MKVYLFKILIHKSFFKKVVSLIIHGTEKIKHWIKPLEFLDSVQSFFHKKPKRFISTNVSRSEQVIQMLINMSK